MGGTLDLGELQTCQVTARDWGLSVKGASSDDRSNGDQSVDTGTATAGDGGGPAKVGIRVVPRRRPPRVITEWLDVVSPIELAPRAPGRRSEPGPADREDQSRLHCTLIGVSRYCAGWLVTRTSMGRALRWAWGGRSTARLRQAQTTQVGRIDDGEREGSIRKN